MKDARKLVILILHDLNMFSTRAPVDVCVSLHREGALHGVAFSWSAMEMTKYEVTATASQPTRISSELE